MATDKSTLARPYAKAVFETAQQDKAFADWSNFLSAAALVTQDANVAALLNNPKVTKADLVELYSAVCASVITDKQANFLKILAENERLGVLAEIAVIYDDMRAEAEKTAKVQVRTFMPLTDVQQNQLSQALTKRLNRQVQLDIHEDKSILGGAIVRSGDLVIDGSVLGKLRRLQQAVAG